MRSRTFAALALVAALGVSSSVSASTSPPPRTVTAPTASGQTVRLHVGDRLKVQLDSSFHRPRSSNRSVLARRSAAGGYPSTEDAQATFKALVRGRADVTSQSDNTCLHEAPPCEIAQQVYVLHVIVVR